MNAVILAGGKSIRYGSHKALINIRDKTLIEMIIKKLRISFSRIYVVGNNEIDYSFLKGVILLEDIIPGKGPLGGLYTGLKYSDSRYNFILGCDMPNLTEDYFKFMQEQKKEYDVLVPEYNGYIEPLAGVYANSCLPAIKQSLSSDNLKIKNFYERVNVKIIKEETINKITDPAKLFFNINYKSDIAVGRKYLQM